MTNYFMFLSFTMFSISLVAFCTRNKHIISMLLSLEMMALSVLVAMSEILLVKGSENFILISFLVMIVCEGSLGLSLLVMMTRFFGNDLLKTSNLLKS